MMQTNREEKRKDKKGMFMKLFKYIIGVNSEATEIDMTTPVTTKRTKVGIICLHLWHGSVADTHFGWSISGHLTNQNLKQSGYHTLLF